MPLHEPHSVWFTGRKLVTLTIEWDFHMATAADLKTYKYHTKLVRYDFCKTAHANRMFLILPCWKRNLSLWPRLSVTYLFQTFVHRMCTEVTYRYELYPNSLSEIHTVLDATLHYAVSSFDVFHSHKRISKRFYAAAGGRRIMKLR